MCFSWVDTTWEHPRADHPGIGTGSVFPPDGSGMTRAHLRVQIFKNKPSVFTASDNLNMCARNSTGYTHIYTHIYHILSYKVLMLATGCSYHRSWVWKAVLPPHGTHTPQLQRYILLTLLLKVGEQFLQNYRATEFRKIIHSPS